MLFGMRGHGGHDGHSGAHGHSDGGCCGGGNDGSAKPVKRKG
jgi:hypothetical protein